MSSKEVMLPNKRNASCTWCRWNGVEYFFNERQAAVVAILWKQWEQDPEIPLADWELVREANLFNPRLRDTFRGHAAWGEMIVEGGRPGYRKLSRNVPTDYPAFDSQQFADRA